MLAGNYRPNSKYINFVNVLRQYQGNRNWPFQSQLYCWILPTWTSLNTFERILLSIFSNLLCLINSYFLITKSLILYVLCKEKLGTENCLGLKGLKRPLTLQWKIIVRNLLFFSVMHLLLDTVEANINNSNNNINFLYISLIQSSKRFTSDYKY